jgi:hypothetical protein
MRPRARGPGSPRACAGCGRGLPQVGGRRVGRNQVIDLPAFAPVVIEAWQDCMAGDQCGKQTVGSYPAGLEPRRTFGPDVEALLRPQAGPEPPGCLPGRRRALPASGPPYHDVTRTWVVTTRRGWCLCAFVRPTEALHVTRPPADPAQPQETRSLVATTTAVSMTTASDRPRARRTSRM